MIGYSIIRFGIEYLRGDPRAAVGALSISQTISVVLITVGLLFLGCSRLNARAKAVD
jgi:prolipoprotein diacylglyceryltransferase